MRMTSGVVLNLVSLVAKVQIDLFDQATKFGVLFFMFISIYLKNYFFEKFFGILIKEVLRIPRKSICYSLIGLK